MIRNGLSVFILLVVLALLSSCASAPHREAYVLELDQLFDANFKDFQPPKAARVKEAELKRKYTHTTFDRVWDSAVLLLMQQCVIARASRASGIIVCVDGAPLVWASQGEEPELTLIQSGFPSAVLIEEQGPEEVFVYVDWLTELYRRVDKRDAQGVGITELDKWKLAEAFFDCLAVEVFADRIWDHLLE